MSESQLGLNGPVAIGGRVISEGELVWANVALMLKFNIAATAIDVLHLFMSYAFKRMLIFNAPGTGSFEMTSRYPPPQPEYIAPQYCCW